jgi:phage terminase large subunit-like protein
MVRHESQWKTSAAESLLATACRRIPTVARYSLDVITGNVPAGRLVFLAVERFLNDLSRSRGAQSSDNAFPYYFDEGGAVSIIKFFRDLAPFRLEPFQQFIVANIFGWKKTGVHCPTHPHGHRRFQTAYIEVGKGNGKTPLAAGIGIYGLRFDEEPSAEIHIAAPSKAQAVICFKDAVRMIDDQRELRKIFKKHGCSGPMLSGNISYGTSFMRPISHEHGTLDGFRPHMVIPDELHEHVDTLVLDKLTAGFKARHQPLSFEITNSGWDRETICFQHHDYSRQVLERVFTNEAWFAYVCQLDVCAKCRLEGKEQPTCDDCDSWLDPDVWLKADPGLGTILPREYLEKQVKLALEIPAGRNLTQRLNFCIWTQSDERFISPEAWRACSWESEVVSPADPELLVAADPTKAPCGHPRAWRDYWLRALKGKICFGAVDLGVVNDFSCLALLFPAQRDVPKPILLLWAWVPADVDCHQLLKERYGYNQWVSEGFLQLTPGQRTDYSLVERDILQLNRDFRIEELAFDKRYSFDLVQRLIAAGVECTEHSQASAFMTGPIKEFQRQVIGCDFVHGANPLLTFNVDNLVVHSDGKGNLSCVKPGNPNSPRKIDAAVASIMAIGRAAMHPEAGADGGQIFFA